MLSTRHAGEASGDFIVKTAITGSSESYYLFENKIGSKKLPINKKQHEDIKDAILTIKSAGEIEELFQIFATSFLRFEKDQLDTSLEFAYSQHSKVDYVTQLFKNARQRFNVSLITILTSFQSYVDHSDRIFKHLKSLPEAQDYNKSLGNTAYDGHLSYRVCAALRNYAQHHALPLEGFAIDSTNIYPNDDIAAGKAVARAYNTSPWLDVLKFSDSSKVKRKLKDELANLGYKQIDLKWLVRDFVVSMYNRHAALREYLKPTVETSSAKITEAYGLYNAKHKGDASHLALHEEDGIHHLKRGLAAQVLEDFNTYTLLKYANKVHITSQIKSEKSTYTDQQST
ncbi:hypothetical protein [Maritalea myrionectae]|uniref:hypothetical protein n=1 Tax=Maritalea myrionectae TaxID=454601 RepID=UPI000413D51E|nr:hypothetical protein [Maritalea myrionectae]